MNLFEAAREAYSFRELASSFLTTILTVYGITFVFDLICVPLFLKKFFRLYNVQSDNDFVMSSSTEFSDGKSILPLNVWLMLIIPYYYVYFFLHYAYVLKKLYPNGNIRLSPYYVFSLGITVVCLIAMVFLQFSISAYNQFNDDPINASFIFIPAIVILIGNFICFLQLLLTIRKNFYLPEVLKEE